MSSRLTGDDSPVTQGSAGGYCCTLVRCPIPSQVLNALYMSGSVRVVSLLATPVSMHSMMLASSHVRPAAHWDPVMVPGCKTRRPLMQPGLARPQTACASISRSMSDKMRYSFRIRGRLSPSQKAEEVCRQTQCVFLLNGSGSSVISHPPPELNLAVTKPSMLEGLWVCHTHSLPQDCALESLESS